MLFSFSFGIFPLPIAGISRIPPVTGGACLTMIVQIDTSEFDRYDEKPRRTSEKGVCFCRAMIVNRAYFMYYTTGFQFVYP